MPRNRQAHHNYADVSIKEFADAKIARPNGRIRKKMGHGLQADQNNKSTEEDILEEEIDNVYIFGDKLALAKAKSANDHEQDANHSYSVYPIDFWYMISEYIRPEDVTRFALICKQSYAITTSVKFWKYLYRRYYDGNVALPVRLQWDCMTRPGGIRACTIRSLYYTYPLFVNRLRKQSQQDFHTLTKRNVLQFWYQQVNATKWIYFYKLKQRLAPGTRAYESEQMQRRNSKSLKSLRDVYLNTEEGCTLLMVESTKFHPLPLLDIMADGSKLVLSSIAHHLARSCDHYRLEISFSNVGGRETVAFVVYEPAVSIRVYDWWMPTYSKYVKQGFQPKLEYLRDEKEVPDEQNLTDDDAWDYVINNF